MQLDQIIKGCKKQKADCQKMLYQQYYSIMMAICNRYSSSLEDAEEMLNNGFLNIFIKIDQFEDKGSFEGWMKRTMVNCCLDFLKSKQAKQSKLVNSMPAVENESAYFDNTLYQQGAYDEIAIEEKYSLQELKQYLNYLSEPTKTVFNLSVFEEHSHKEIGLMLNMAERTSQWHLSNAKKTLAELLLKKNEVKKVVGL